MTINRRQLAVAGVFALGASLLAARPSVAESADEAAAAKAVEDLRQAMLAADKAKLESLVADQLSYGHSSGKLESKAVFVEVVASKKTIYKSINLTDHKITVAGNNAIARHTWDSVSESDGKSSTAHIGVLQVWVKDGGAWKLLARQAFKI